MVKGLTRGQARRLENGAKICPTDNAPAWWIHFQLFTQDHQQFGSFEPWLRRMPCHMFEVNLPENISTAGWHVAHIYNVKDVTEHPIMYQ